MIKENQVVKGKVKSISDKYFWVDLEDDYQGVIFVNEISDYFVSDINKVVTIGDIISLKVLTVNHKNKKSTLSYKAIRPKYQKSAYIYLIKPTAKGFKNLKKHAEEEINNEEIKFKFGFCDWGI
ncbi:S1 RNA-binding domain-containing protein [Candidatus Mycoplasma pogonae]